MNGSFGHFPLISTVLNMAKTAPYISINKLMIVSLPLMDSARNREIIEGVQTEFVFSIP